MSTRDEDLLRGVIREVLAELLPGLLEDALTAPTAAGNGHRPQAATVGMDDAVVPQVPAPPIARVHRPSGWRAPAAPAPAESAAQAATPTIQVERGAVTERAVKEAARTGARLVLSPRAVLTPLARDCARSLGVEIEKEKPW
jgi:hypothetical protein